MQRVKTLQRFEFGPQPQGNTLELFFRYGLPTSRPSCLIAARSCLDE
jgi:hypothetical protein